MAGEMARLTELESHPAFLWCDGKYNNTASVKDQRHAHMSTTPAAQHVLPFPSNRSYMVSQLTTRWVAPSAPFIWSSWRCQRKWLWGLSHINLSPRSHPSSSSLQQHPPIDPAVSHPAFSYSTVCTCYYSFLYPPPNLLYLMHTYQNYSIAQKCP